MSNNKKATSQIGFIDDYQLEGMSSSDVRSQLVEAREDLYRLGLLVKALDETGEPLFRNGQQVYKAADYATSAERDFWHMENNVN